MITMSAFTHIIHLGDIHIRNGNSSSVRLKEYQEVFRRLEEDLVKLECVQNNTALIAVCGDIFHNKNKLEPYAVQLWNQFITILTNLAPTVLICGNHDFRQETSDVPDLIQVMYDIMGKTKHSCHYLNKTGTYLFENIEFGLVCIKDTLHDCSTSGLVDELPDFPVPIHVEAVHVALFHGTITQSSLPNGQTIPAGKGYPLEWFKGYDMVLLGDNHKQQLHTSAWGMPWGYPGSLIQQDIGEPVYGHGYILWNVHSKTGECHHIYNPYGRIKARLRKELLQIRLDTHSYVGLEQNNHLSWFPKTPYVQVVGNIGDEVPVLEKLQAFDIHPVHIHTTLATSREIFEEEEESRIDTIIHEISGLNNPSKWLDYLDTCASDVASYVRESQWLEKPANMLMEMVPANISSELSSMVTKIRTKILDSIDTYTKANTHICHQNHKVILKHMAWEWTFSYGQENWFDFEKMEGHIAILNGPNASGKSSFIDTLCIGLFGEATPYRQMNSTKKISSHYIHSQRPNTKNATNAMHVKIILEVDGKRHELIRKFIMRADKNEGNALSAEVFYIDTNTNEKQLKVSGTTLVNDWVNNHIGTIDDIMKTSIVTQVDNHNFFYAKPEEQKKIIDHAVNLTVLQAYSAVVHEALLGYNSLLKTLGTILNTTLENATDENDLIASDNEIETYTHEFQALANKIPLLEKERDELVSVVGEFLKKPPTKTYEEWEEIHQSYVDNMELFENQFRGMDVSSIKSKLNERKSVLLHIIEKLGHTYDTKCESSIKIDSDTYKRLKEDEKQLKEALQSLQSSRPGIARPLKILEESIGQLEEWFTKNEEWICNPEYMETLTQESQEKLTRATQAYEKWLTYHVSTPECVDEDEDEEGGRGEEDLEEWENYVSQYNAEKNAHECLEQELNGLLKIYNNSGGYKEDEYQAWLKKWEDYRSSEQMCDEEGWTDIEQCRKNLQDTQAYILKRNLLIQEYENAKLQAEKNRDILKGHSSWEDEYQSWKQKEDMYQTMDIEHFETVIQDRKSLQENRKMVEKKRDEAKKQLDEILDEDWMSDYHYWKEKEDQMIKYKWDNKDRINEQIRLYEDAMIQVRLYEKQIENYETLLLEAKDYTYNPSCEACCKHPYHKYRGKIEKELDTLKERLHKLGDYKGLEKRLVFYKKGLECHIYVEKHRAYMEPRYAEYSTLEKKYNDIIRACDAFIEKMPAPETVEASLLDATNERDTFIMFKKHYESNLSRFKWLSELDSEKNKYEKLFTRLEKKLERMEKDEALERTLAYWEKSIQTCNFIEANKDIHLQKEVWDSLRTQFLVYEALQYKVQESKQLLQKLHRRAYTNWCMIGQQLRRIKDDYTQELHEQLKAFEQLQEKKLQYDGLLAEKKLHTVYSSWETKVNLIESKLKDIQLQLHTYELQDIDKDLKDMEDYIKIQELSTKAERAIAWYKYQTVKNDLSHMHTRYSFLNALLEQYKRDSRRNNHKSSSQAFLQTLFQEWTRRRDILQRLDEKLVNEKGKKTGDTDTFKEWIYAQHVIPLLEKQVNRFLANIDSIRIRISYTSKTLLFYVQDRGNETSFAASSGYQQFVIGLAMRQALSIIGGSGNNLQHMFIDEGFTACDASNLEKTHDVLRLLIQMGHYRSILLVTHLEHIKDMIPLKINITRDNAFSHLSYGNYYPTFTNTLKQRKGRPIKAKDNS